MPTIFNKFTLWVSKTLIAAAHYYSENDINWLAKPYNFHFETKPYFSDYNSEFSYTEWIVKNIPAFKPEQKMPHPDNYMTYIQFAPSYWKNSWDNISKDYYKDLFLPQLVVTNNIEEQAKKLTSDCKTDMEKIEKVFQFVQKIRYVAIELGIGGRRPHKPEEVLKNGYGDCKDKAILLISFLKALNIEAKPVLVLTKDQGVIDPVFPLMKFNHMIVNVYTNDKQDVWMDPTIEYAVAGELNSSCRDIHVLVINNDGTSRLEKTPALNFSSNTEEVNINVDIPDENTIVYDLNFQFIGQENIYYRYFFKDKTADEISKTCKKMLKKEYIQSEIENFHKSNLDSLNEPFEFGFRVKVKNGIQRQADIYLVDFNPLDKDYNIGWLSSKDRKYPIAYEFPYSEKVHVKLNLKKNNFKIKSLPNNLMFNEPELYFKSIAFDKESGEINLEQEKEVRTALISEKKFDFVKNFYETLAKSTKEKLILTR